LADGGSKDESPDSAPKLMYNDQLLEKIIDEGILRMDENNDGYVDWVEFQKHNT